MTIFRNRQAVQDFVGANRCQIGMAEKSGSRQWNKREHWASRGSNGTEALEVRGETMCRNAVSNPC
jgi:hypothetical protein